MRVVFNFDARRIDIEGDGPELVEVLTLVREIAPKLPNISIVAEGSGNAKRPEKSGENGSREPAQATQTMRQFVKGLSLTNTSERIAAIAYYLKTQERPAFSPKEMASLFTQVGMQKPSQMPVAVFDAKRKYGYVDSAGHGAWKISVEGENMIVRKLEEAGEAE